MRIYNVAVLLLSLLLLSTGCDHRSVTGNNRTTMHQPARKAITVMKSPVRGTDFTIGDQIPVEVDYPDSISVDSMQVFLRGSLTGTYLPGEEISISTQGISPGMTGVRVKVFFNDSVSESHSSQVIMLSDIIPAHYTYRVVHKYPHDRTAYTQGLIYYNGWLYEGTGNYNQSTIRKVRLQDGEVIQVRNNASDIFGEGIAIFNGKIYQLTYKSQVCFIYNLNSFEEIKKVYFQNKEGWGLTNNETQLIMSDGTNIIYFLDPELFTVVRQIEVYDDKEALDSLNELEYIRGKIFANRYYTDEIVIIDPETGKVEGKINLKGILPVAERNMSTNVLNGIAWDEEQNRLFVTGKNWPELYEIDLVPVGDH